MTPLLTISEVAELVGVSLQTLRRWEASGLLVPQRTAGGHRRYSRADVEQLLSRWSA